MVAEFKDHFSSYASDYAEHRPRYPRALAKFLATCAAGCSLAVDCGCGSGQLSTLLGDFFNRVIALDASAAQIASATPHPRVEYRVAPEVATGLPNGCADLVVAAQAAHWFDLPAFYAEARRIARTGATIALVGYGLSSVAPNIDAIIAPFYHKTVGPYWPPERVIVDDAYASIEFPFNETRFPKLDMCAAWTLRQFVSYVSTWSAVKAFEKANDRSPLPELAKSLEPAWSGMDAIREVRWPLFGRIGTVESP